MVDRDYDWSMFTRESQYGVATPHDNTGSGVKNAMHWMTDALRSVILVQYLLVDSDTSAVSPSGQ